MGLISSAVLLLYGLFAGSNEDLFWSLFAFSGVLFLLPYVGMMLAFLRLRIIDAGRHRPYSVPGGPVVALLLGWLCLAVLAMAMVLFMYTPGGGPEWAVITGVAALLIVGEGVIRYSELRRARAAQSDSVATA